jgi:RWP-RK domain
VRDARLHGMRADFAVLIPEQPAGSPPQDSAMAAQRTEQRTAHGGKRSRSPVCPRVIERHASFVRLDRPHADGTGTQAVPGRSMNAAPASSVSALPLPLPSGSYSDQLDEMLLMEYGAALPPPPWTDEAAGPAPNEASHHGANDGVHRGTGGVSSRDHVRKQQGGAGGNENDKAERVRVNRIHGGVGRRLTIEQLSVHFDKTMKEATQALGVCPTTLKRACRRLGIARWPRADVAAVRTGATAAPDITAPGGAAPAAAAASAAGDGGLPVATSTHSFAPAAGGGVQRGSSSSSSGHDGSGSGGTDSSRT